MALQLKGAKELDAKLAELAGIAETKAVRAAMRDALKPAMEAASANVPTGTDRTHRTYLGRLVTPGFASRSLRRVVSRPRNGVVRAMLGVAKEAFYAINFFEFGTSRVPAQPWIVPAFESNKQAMLDRYLEALRRKIKAIARKGAKS